MHSFILQNCVNLVQIKFHIYFVFMPSYFKCNFYSLFVVILSLGLMFFKVSQLSGLTESFSSSCHLISV